MVSNIGVLTVPLLNFDPEVFGVDCDVFRFDRFAGESGVRLEKDHLLPFGGGVSYVVGLLPYSTPPNSTLLFSTCTQAFPTLLYYSNPTFPNPTFTYSNLPYQALPREEVCAERGHKPMPLPLLTIMLFNY